jgi:small subunit ribosomal protein S6
MRDYELIFIVHPELDEAALTEVVTRVQGWITDGGGEVSKVDMWGKRKLAYLIRKQTEGHYVYMDVKMGNTVGPQLERNLGILEPIMRYSIIVKE